MTATVERPRVAQISTRDVQAPAGAVYGEPHPTVWATETVMRDSWEVIAYRRQITSETIGRIEFRAYVEQSPEPGASLEFVVDVVGGNRIDLGGSPREQGELKFPLKSFYAAQREAYRFRVDHFGRRIRPGILEILADALGVSDDAALAQRLGFDTFSLTLMRRGFTPFGGNDDAKWRMCEALVNTGLARNDAHARCLLTTPGQDPA